MKKLGRVVLVAAALLILVWPAGAQDLVMTDQGRRGAELLLENNGYEITVFRGVFEKVEPETLSYVAHVSGIADTGLLCDAWITVEHGMPKTIVIKMVTDLLVL